MAKALPTPPGSHACIAARAGLDALSRERVRMEMLKLLVARHAVPTLAVMAESGLLVPVLGGVPDLAGFENMAKVEAAAGVQADAVRRLGALGVRIVEDAERLWQRLRLSNAEHERLAAMADGWWRVSPGEENLARALLYRLGPERFVDRVLLAWARSPAAADDPRGTTSRRCRSAGPRRCFRSRRRTSSSAACAKGPALGAALRAAEEAWIAADFFRRSRA